MAERLVDKIRRELGRLETDELLSVAKSAADTLNPLGKLALAESIIESLGLDEIIALMQFGTEQMVYKRHQEKDTSERAAEEKCTRILQRIRADENTLGYKFLKEAVLESFFIGQKVEELFLHIAKRHEIKVDTVKAEMLKAMLGVKSSLTGNEAIVNPANKEAFTTVFEGKAEVFSDLKKFISHIIEAMKRE